MIEVRGGQDQYLLPWVCDKLGIELSRLATSYGIFDADRLLAVVMYDNYSKRADGTPISIEMSIASVDKRWANKLTISKVLAYPFCTLGVRRVQATTSERAIDTRLFLERLGFVFEGIAREADRSGDNAACYSMLAREYFSSRWNASGKIKQPARSNNDSEYADCGQRKAVAL